jgi:hypothetical protein
MMAAEEEMQREVVVQAEIQWGAEELARAEM